MRKLSEVTATIVPISHLARPYARRQIRSAQNSLTVLTLVKHDESAGQIQVSDDGDAASAVWLSRGPIMIDARDFGRFVVVTMPEQLARQKNLKVYKFWEFDRLIPDERALLRAAIEAAGNSRRRLMYGGRRPALHPNATA